MAVGDNAGHQLNLFIFELGMITRDPAGLLPDIVQTIAIHPLVVAPSQVSYTDASRGSVTQTAQGSLRTIGGRALLQVQLSGAWGVESRGLGLYIGTGDLRFKRFWHEIVRLSSATNKEQVDREKDTFRSPFLGLALKPYDEERSSFFVNYYDFWHDVSCELEPSTFTFNKQHRSGGASGLTHYTFSGQEAGPLVVGGLGTTLLKGLFDALTTWDSLNEIIKSYTLQSVLDSFGAVAGLLNNQVAETFEAGQEVFKLQSAPATGMLHGFSAGAVLTTINADGEEEGVNLSRYLGDTAALASSAVQLADSLAQLSDSQEAAETGQVDWRSAREEGQIDALEAAEQIDALHAVADAAAFQAAAGAFYGMSREEYQEYLASTGQSSSSSVGGSIRHVVRPWDTAASIAAEYGVDFDLVLRVNRLLPSEALLEGTVLQIPRERPIGPQSQIDGLPVFGSHRGQAAWGQDLYADLRVDDDGALAILAGEDVLVQGMKWLIAQHADDVLEFVTQVPDVENARATATRRRVSGILATDRRISSVDEVSVDEQAGVIDVAITATAINGGSISTSRT